MNEVTEDEDEEIRAGQPWRLSLGRMAGIGVDRKALNHAKVFNKRAADGLRMSVSKEQGSCRGSCSGIGNKRTDEQDGLLTLRKCFS